MLHSLPLSLTTQAQLCDAQEVHLVVRDQGRSVQAVWPAVGHLSAHVQMLGCIICNDVEDRGRQLSTPLHVSWVSDDMQISDMHFLSFRSWQCIYSGTYLWASTVFVSKSGCFMKLHIDLLGCWWPANPDAINTGTESPFPAVCSCWCLQTQTFAFIFHSHQS